MRQLSEADDPTPSEVTLPRFRHISPPTIFMPYRKFARTASARMTMSNQPFLRPLPCQGRVPFPCRGILCDKRYYYHHLLWETPVAVFVTLFTRCYLNSMRGCGHSDASVVRQTQFYRNATKSTRSELEMRSFTNWTESDFGVARYVLQPH